MAGALFCEGGESAAAQTATTTPTGTATAMATSTLTATATATVTWTATPTTTPTATTTQSTTPVATATATLTSTVTPTRTVTPSVTATALALHPHAIGTPRPEAVYGQPDFTSNTGGTSATNLNLPRSVAINPTNDEVVVGDIGNNRIMVFDTTATSGAAARAALGQPDFTSTGPATSATKLNQPTGAAVDITGRIWVADAQNYRVVGYPANAATGAAATTVYGQPNFTSSLSCCTYSASQIGSPGGVATDSSGNVWVADNSNNRILMYPAGTSSGGAATKVLGQTNFTAGAAGTTATTLRGPAGMAFDASDNLYVVDQDNKRVLVFAGAPNLADGAAATTVLGQATFTTSSSGTSATTFSNPYAIAVTGAGDIYVVDSGNTRVLYFPPGSASGAAATRVYGQPDFVTTSSSGPTAYTLSNIQGVAVDGNGNLYIGDLTNNRVVVNLPPFAGFAKVSALSTTSGPAAGGTSVTLTGVNFNLATSVVFGTTAAASFTINSDTSITTTSPANTAGVVDVTVVTGGGTSSTSAADQFTYTAPIATTTPTVTVTPTVTATSTMTVTPTATAAAQQSSGGGTSNNATSATGTSSTNGNGQLTVITGSTSASGGAQVIGPQVPNTGVADLPAGFTALPFGSVFGPNSLPPISPESLTGSGPAPIQARVSASTGGIVIAGNVAIVLPPAALTGVAGGQLTVTVGVNPSVVVPGGPAQFSPNGTILDISFRDGDGKLVTTFPTLIPIELKYNAADLGQANGNAGVLTAAYVIDADSPPIENPLGFPIGTFVLFPPQNVSTNTTTGTVTVYTQALGSVVSVVTNPVGYVQTVSPSTTVLSSFDTDTAQVFGTKAQFSYLQVVEPQIGRRLLVLDPDTGNYAYVNVSDVGPSGPPPGRSSSAVVRGLLDR